MVRLTRTCAITGALLSTCATISARSGNLRGADENSVPDEVLDLLDDLNYIDPFEGFDWERTIPIENNESESLRDHHRREQMDDAERENQHSKFGGHFREEDDAAPEVESRIVGGSMVGTSDTKPWMCMTLDDRNGQQFRGSCGASLITKDWALTAAHCISNYRKDDLKDKMDYLYVNAFRPWDKLNGKNNYGQPYQKVRIAAIYEHYGHATGAAKPHDIALLQLAEEVNIQDFSPIALPQFSPDSIQLDRRATTYGFGQTSYGGYKVEELRKVDVGYVPRGTCQKFMSDWTITDDMICAAASGKDACGGDSGGPLTIMGGSNNNVEILIGVVSWGYKCAEMNYPGVYSSTFEHLPWMKNIMGSDYFDIKFEGQQGSLVTDAGSQYEGNGPAPASSPLPYYTQSDINRKCLDEKDENYQVTVGKSTIKCKDAGKKDMCNWNTNTGRRVDEVCCKGCKNAKK